MHQQGGDTLLDQRQQPVVALAADPAIAALQHRTGQELRQVADLRHVQGRVTAAGEQGLNLPGGGRRGGSAHTEAGAGPVGGEVADAETAAATGIAHLLVQPRPVREFLAGNGGQGGGEGEVLDIVPPAGQIQSPEVVRRRPRQAQSESVGDLRQGDEQGAVLHDRVIRLRTCPGQGKKLAHDTGEVGCGSHACQLAEPGPVGVELGGIDPGQLPAGGIAEGVHALRVPGQSQA